MEVYDDNGNVCDDNKTVFETWHTDFNGVYNPNNEIDYDQTFYDNILQHKRLLEDNMLDPLYVQNDFLNAPISRQEIEKVIYKAKNNKSCGFDKIPYEVLKFTTVIDVLHSLFQFCLDTGKIPSIWRNAMILPIPKDATKDPRVPLNYRGISRLPCISKLYSSFLNNRLLPYLEANDMLVDVLT